MGWKSFSVFVQPPDRPSFGGASSASEQEADALCDALVPGGYRRADARYLEEAIYPQNRDLYLGCFGPSAIVCEQDIACAFFEGRKHLWRHGTSSAAGAARDAILTQFPSHEVSALVLHSVVNLWGYAVYRDGALVRCAAGAADDGIISDIGPQLPEEQAVLRGRTLAEFDEEQGGEELVFEVSRRLFGRRMDEAAIEMIPMVRYVPTAAAPGTWLKRLFGR